MNSAPSRSSRVGMLVARDDDLRRAQAAVRPEDVDLAHDLVRSAVQSLQDALSGEKRIAVRHPPPQQHQEDQSLFLREAVLAHQFAEQAGRAATTLEIAQVAFEVGHRFLAFLHEDRRILDTIARPRHVGELQQRLEISLCSQENIPGERNFLPNVEPCAGASFLFTVAITFYIITSNERTVNRRSISERDPAELPGPNLCPLQGLRRSSASRSRYGLFQTPGILLISTS